MRFQVRSQRLALAGVTLLWTALGGPALGRAAIVSTLEEPASVASGVGTVRGWAFSTTPGAKLDAALEVTIDGSPSIEAACCTDRGDVGTAFPEHPSAQRSGFAGQFNGGLLAPGAHEVCVHLKPSAGESEVKCKTFQSRRVADLPFLPGYQFSESTECSFYNGTPAGTDASFECSHVLLTRNSDGKKFECSGTVVFSWDKGTQTFRQSSNCD